MMKRRLFMVAIMASMGLMTFGQNLLTGGNMEKEISGTDTLWHVLADFHSGSTSPQLYQFGYTNDGPSLGVGGCLYVSGSLNGGAVMQTNYLYWEPVTLQGGVTYKISGLLKNISTTWVSGAAGAWCQFEITPTYPVATGQYDTYLGINTWNGCGDGVDGYIEQQDTCVGKKSPYYRLPDSLSTGSHTAYFCIEIGAYTGADPISFDLLIDELSLTDSASSGSSGIKYVTDNSIALSNYPNPVTSSSTIAYTIHESGNVQLAVYNLLGQQVATLVQKFQAPGTYRVRLDASQFSNNVYYCSLKINNKMTTRKILIMK